MKIYGWHSGESNNHLVEEHAVVSNFITNDIQEMIEMHGSKVVAEGITHQSDSVLHCYEINLLSFEDPFATCLETASTDQSTVDTNIPHRLKGLAFTVIQLLGIATIISLVAWQVLIILTPVTAISLWYQLRGESYSMERL